MSNAPGVRFGLRRPPLLTAAVAAVTATMALAQAADGRLLRSLERTPAELHGDWWRLGTSLVVQDGGVAGATSNLIFLLVIGAIAEQVLSRPQWAAQYFGVGLASELVGYEWQPVGGGNSVAVCGLAGAVAVAAFLQDERLPAFAPPALLVWCGALLGTVWWPLIVVGVVAARVAWGRPAPALRPAALGVVATGIALSAATNIHGAALLFGLGAALVPVTAGARLRGGDP